MPQITLTEDEALDLRTLLHDLQSVCRGEERTEPVTWEQYAARIRTMRLQLFGEE